MAKRRVQLSPDQVSRINAALRDLHDLEPDFKALEDCGEDCQSMRESAEEMRRQFTVLKERYSP